MPSGGTYVGVSLRIIGLGNIEEHRCYYAVNAIIFAVACCCANLSCGEDVVVQIRVGEESHVRLVTYLLSLV